MLPNACSPGRSRIYRLSGLDLVHPDDLELVLRSLASVQARRSAADRGPGEDGHRLASGRGDRAPVTWRAGRSCSSASGPDRTATLRGGRNEEARLRTMVQTRRPSSSSSRPPAWCRRHRGPGASSGARPELIEHRPLAELAADADRPCWRARLNGPREGRRWRAGDGGGTAAPPCQRPGRPFELTIVNLLDDPTVGGSWSPLTTSPPAPQPRLSCATPFRCSRRPSTRLPTASWS